MFQILIENFKLDQKCCSIEILSFKFLASDGMFAS